MVTILFSQVTHLSMSNNPLIGLDPFVLASAVPNLTRFNIIGVIVVAAVIFSYVIIIIIIIIITILIISNHFFSVLHFDPVISLKSKEKW